jgi:hypothetical protein
VKEETRAVSLDDRDLYSLSQTQKKKTHSKKLHKLCRLRTVLFNVIDEDSFFGILFVTDKFLDFVNKVCKMGIASIPPSSEVWISGKYIAYQFT